MKLRYLLFLPFVFLLAFQSTTAPTVQEADGSPKKTGITKFIFPNGSVSISGTTATISGAAITNSATANGQTFTGTNGQAFAIASLSELVTLSTSGATTDSTIDLPAGSIILAVTARITTTIAGIDSTSLQLGDPTTAARFGSAAAFTAGTTAIGITALNGNITTTAAGPTQAASAKVRLTLAGGADNTPSAGAVRIVINYIVFTAPTS